MKDQIDQIGKREKEHTFKCARDMEREEHSEEWLKFFNQEAKQEITVECEPTTEERETYSMDFSYLCEELGALERRVKMQRNFSLNGRKSRRGKRKHRFC
jgi:hypothetical protein